MINANDFLTKLKKIMNEYNTVYMLGCFGQPVTNSIINQKAKQLPSFYTQARVRRFKSLVGSKHYGFDCIGVIKAVLWGWTGNRLLTNGGAKYCSNGVPDIGADAMIKQCSGVSSDFTKIDPGEAVHRKGHIGVYLGNGLVLEATNAWTGKVMTTALANIGGVPGYHARKWTSHGKMPYVEYTVSLNTTGPVASPTAPKIYVGKVTSLRGVNVRKAPTINGIKITAIPFGKRVNVLSQGEWDKVQFDNTTGYVIAKSLTIME